MKGLLIKSPWIDLIFQGRKTWEVRGTSTSIRGKIALIKSGSGKVFGTVDLVDSKKLSLIEYQKGSKYHAVPEEDCFEAPYKNINAWVFQNPTLFPEPIPYKHPLGAVIWVNLNDLD